MVAISRRSLFRRGARISAATVALLALPAVAQAAPAPAAKFDAAVARLRVGFLTRGPAVQEAIINVITSFADLATPQVRRSA